MNKNTGFILKGSGTLTKKHDDDAGLDISSSEDIVISSRSSYLVSTDLFISLPKCHVGLIKSRSGLSVKYKIEVGAGVIDCGYSGEIKVHLYNHSDDQFTIRKGDRIAQLLTLPVNLNRYVRTESNIDETINDRGTNGFGSTGVNRHIKNVDKTYDDETLSTICPECSNKHIVDFISTKNYYCVECYHTWSYHDHNKREKKNFIQHTR